MTTLPLGRLPRYAHASLKTSSKNSMRKNGSWRKEYISFVNCITHVVSLKTLREKSSSKNSHRKKEYNIYPSWSCILQNIPFFMNRYLSSWSMHKLQCFSKYDLLDLCNSSGFNYLQGRFTQIAPPHRANLWTSLFSPHFS